MYASPLRAFALATLALALLPAHAARAFCGFYVEGSGEQLYNDATFVTMMREGTRTVLSMQNNYRGPVANFAMVVPVPVVLQEENVKTLPRAIFDKIDKLAAPRLVEYWEQDPCHQPEAEMRADMAMPSAASPSAAFGGARNRRAVTVEAEFTVGEYDIVILSAREAGALNNWLVDNGYQIPANAEPLLRPYVASGSKFFVAKIDPEKVTFENGQALLSPLRFHYDSDTFQLPVRLGLVNSAGAQDLIVHILARGKRYEVANYPNVTVPTNIDVAESMREQFGEFYVELFDETLRRNPRAVITEYSWDAGTCDPCPGPTLTGRDLQTLGADVLTAASADAPMPPRQFRGRGRRGGGGFVLTRLHARYGANSLGEDLVFREAGAIMGGREVRGVEGLEQGSREAHRNNFQARYAVRHAWEGAIECDNPRRGIWGGPPGGQHNAGTRPARDLASATRGTVNLTSSIRSSVAELDIANLPVAGAAPTNIPLDAESIAQSMRPKLTDMSSPPVAANTGGVSGSRGCGCAVGTETNSGALAFIALLGVVLVRRRRD